ncbi:putative N-acetyltransferase YhbS [Diaminobutyricimonas aerilata]|uniref:Putative N-acetyltransferase YhbS n=1 Tax=Diaminobutyricimonas aerilata TaxID=1162967 RepID=A0A2M9CLZ0_9MICO|nr:GNAT family N-acetyltransferase [Diaminobutyricimonas aerilata]PJJ72915.1 putative N-acetyltransferase YhbS [Diaminobutyricimonas aerilata]
MSRFVIEPVPIPATIDAPDAEAFLGTIDVRNAVETEGFGTDEFEYPAAELLPGWLDPYEPKLLFAARADDRIVARGTIQFALGSDTDTAWISVQVLPDYRHLGIGRALADLLEDLAHDRGCTRVIVYTVSRDGAGPRIPAPTGFGSVPLGNAEVRFLLARGYSLEQVERASRLALPLADGVLEAHRVEADAAAGADYRVEGWSDLTPERRHADMAHLRTRMSTDAPSAGLDEPEDPWSVERLIESERGRLGTVTVLTSAVEHIPSGRLVGFTQLLVPLDTRRPVVQQDTLVLREHRGHRLGMLLKIANLQQLRAGGYPHPSVTTVNAEENRHMLSINEALGFVPLAYEGAWLKATSAPCPLDRGPELPATVEMPIIGAPDAVAGSERRGELQRG